MGKIICEICGTVYPDTEEACPICGYSRDLNSEPGQDEEIPDLAGCSDMPPMEDYLPGEEPGEERSNKGIFDFDAVNPPDPEPEPREGYADYEDLGDEGLYGYRDPDGYSEYEDLGEDLDEMPEPPKQKKQPVFLIIFLVILNVAMLAATAFLFFRYLLPGKLSDRAAETTEIVTEAPTTEETTEPTVPCTSLVMTSSGKVELNKEGQYWLIHTKAMPEDTTDQITYLSENDLVATVSEEGRITAVAEGQTNIQIFCGTQQLTLPVTVVYKEIQETEGTMPALTEGEQPAETEKPTEAPAETEKPAETEPKETEKPAETRPTKPIDPNITLKLKKSDILFKGRGLSTTLELDCELNPEDVEWSSSDSSIIKVDNGKVTTVNYGAATVTARYGDQKAECIVRCAQS